MKKVILVSINSSCRPTLQICNRKASIRRVTDSCPWSTTDSMLWNIRIMARGRASYRIDGRASMVHNWLTMWLVPPSGELFSTTRFSRDWRATTRHHEIQVTKLIVSWGPAQEPIIRQVVSFVECNVSRKRIAIKRGGCLWVWKVLCSLGHHHALMHPVSS